jgi:drug/metabolite transporter (DMT)-like permease
VSASVARPADYGRLVAVPAIWGGTFVGGKIVVASLTPIVGSFARYAVACVALLVAALVLEGGLPRLTRTQWGATFVLGLFGVFAYNLFFMGALEQLPASRAALIIALNPAITIAISALALKGHLSPRRWLGVAVALLGVAIVVSRGDFTSLASGSVGLGELLMFAAVVSWALYTVIGRKVLGGLSPLAATNYAALWGTFRTLVRLVVPLREALRRWPREHLQQPRARVRCGHQRDVAGRAAASLDVDRRSGDDRWGIHGVASLRTFTQTESFDDAKVHVM